MVSFCRCDETENCIGSFVVEPSDCDLDSVSVVLRCKAGLFDSCEYTWNTLTITLPNDATSDDVECCGCSGIQSNSTSILF